MAIATTKSAKTTKKHKASAQAASGARHDDLRGASYPPRARERTMANSAFWRDRADQFLELQNSEKLRAGDYRELEALVTQCASELDADALDLSVLPTIKIESEDQAHPIESAAEVGVLDPFAIWLAALKKEKLTSQFSSKSNEGPNEAEYAHSISTSFIDGLCRSSAAFCKKLEGQAEQRERGEKFQSAVMTLIQNANHTPQRDAASGYSDVERLAEQMGEWDRELKRVARVAQAKRQYREEDARKDFPDLTLWKAVDNSNLSTVRRREFFKNPCQTFGSKDGRFDLIGELTGRAASSAYDIYKQRPNRKKRSPKSNSL